MVGGSFGKCCREGYIIAVVFIEHVVYAVIVCLVLIASTNQAIDESIFFSSIVEKERFVSVMAK